MVGWKIYFAVILILSLYSLLGTVSVTIGTPNQGLLAWMSLLYNVVILLGLYSYISKKQVFSAEVWKILFIVGILMVGYGTVQQAMGTTPVPWVKWVNIALPLPAVYVLYKLGWSR